MDSVDGSMVTFTFGDSKVNRDCLASTEKAIRPIRAICEKKIRRLAIIRRSLSVLVRRLNLSSSD